MAKLTMKKIVSHEVFVDGVSIGVFSADSEWQGLTCLKSPNGTLIVDCNWSDFNSLFDNIFGDVFGETFKCNEGFEINIIKASPEIIEKINDAKKQADK